MARTILPNRRPTITVTLYHRTGSGPELELPVRFGFDEAGAIREFFCTPSKTGTDIQALVNDGALMASILMQRGVSISDLANTLGENRSEGEASGPPSSAFGAIARAGSSLEREPVQTTEGK